MKKKLTIAIIFSAIVGINGCGSGGGGQNGSANVAAKPVIPEVITPTSPVIQNKSVLYATQTAMAQDAICPVGGVKIDMGLDTNGNGTLDLAEIKKTEVICHGLPGIDGSDGIDGKNGVAGKDGAIGAAGLNGKDGINGKDGLNSLVALDDEIAGTHCLAGGVKISVGPDNDQNNSLDAIEIANTRYVCNGQSSATDTPCVVRESANKALTLICGSQEVLLQPGVSYSTFKYQDIAGGKRILDNWNPAGGISNSDAKSFLNMHYQLNVAQQAFFTFAIRTSDEANAVVYLYDSVNSQLLEYRSSTYTSLSIDLPAGRYTVVATAVEKFAGDFSLDITGGEIEIKKIASQTVQLKDEYWESSGGDSFESLRNRHYSLSLTNTTVLSISVDSGIQPRIMLANENGTFLYNDWPTAATISVPAGNYELVIGTRTEYEVGKFDLKITGQFNENNFIKKPYGDFKVISATLPPSNGTQPSASFRYDHYTFTALADSYIDFSLSGMICELWENGVQVFAPRYEECKRLTRTVLKGANYEFVVKSNADVSNYTLTQPTYSLRFSGEITEPVRTQADTVVYKGDTVNTLAGGPIYSATNPQYKLKVLQKTTIDARVTTSFESNKFFLNLYNASNILLAERNRVGLDDREITATLEPGVYTLLIGAQAVLSGSYELNLNYKAGTVEVLAQ